MKKILLLSLIVTVSGQGLHAAAADTINNLSRAAKALPLSTIPGNTEEIELSAPGIGTAYMQANFN